jgi:hypothetical protein
MGFYETPLRRLRLVRAGSLFVLAVAFALIPSWAALDAAGVALSYAAAGGCFLAALFCVWWSRRTPDDSVVYAVPGRAPPAVQIRFYRQMLWTSVAAFPLLAAIVACELHDLESGAKDRARIWEPLVPIYERLGFWPAVLAPVLLGAACCAVFAVKLRKLTSATGADRPPS